MIKCPIPRSRVSPSVKELEFIYNWLKDNVHQGVNVLEFGAGPTTWYINEAIKPNRYIAVETFCWKNGGDNDPGKKAFEIFTKHLSNVELVTRLWYDIPEDIKYKVIFVDSSAGYPPGTPGLHREEAIKYSERLLDINGVVIIHDWHYMSGLGPKKYLESSNYKLIGSIKDFRGVGIYKH